ncbi:hypothetical protein [Arenibacter algicola]|uniref:hypothetical protein n=1 Tax=Arenibacter algicola TaxID=616991 RepID=UPI001D03A0CE
MVAWIEKECKYWHVLRKQQREAERILEIEHSKADEVQRTIEMEEARTKQLLAD